MNQQGRFDALRAQLRRQQQAAQSPLTALQQRLQAWVKGRPVRTYGSRLRRP